MIELNFFIEFYRICLQEAESRLWQIFQNLTIPLNSEIYYVKKLATSDNFEIQQIYRIEMNMPLIIEQFGIISNEQFIDDRVTSITSRRRQNLFGLSLKASMVVTNNSTLQHLTDYR